MAVNYIKLKHGSQEWLDFRLNYIGASELGALCGYNEYKCALELFHEKIGRSIKRRRNLRMSIGLMSESIIAELAEYYDKSEDIFLKNIHTGNKVRIIERVDFVITNDEYPNMCASLDFRFKSKNGNYCPFEAKNKTYSSYAQWENKMNPAELFQISSQNLLSNAIDGGELGYFIDNTKLDIFEVSYESSKQLEKVIKSSVSVFWKKVQQARAYINQIENAKLNYNNKLVAELEYELLQLEPPPENTECYFDYLTEQAKTKKQTVAIKGDQMMLDKATKLLKLRDKKKKIEQEETELKSELATAMRLADKYEIEFGKSGKISFYGGRFSNKIKQ